MTKWLRLEVTYEGHLVQPFCSSRAAQSWLYTTSLGNFCQGSVTLTVTRAAAQRGPEFQFVASVTQHWKETDSFFFVPFLLIFAHIDGTSPSRLSWPLSVWEIAYKILWVKLHIFLLLWGRVIENRMQWALEYIIWLYWTVFLYNNLKPCVYDQ